MTEEEAATTTTMSTTMNVPPTGQAIAPMQLDTKTQYTMASPRITTPTSTPRQMPTMYLLDMYASNNNNTIETENATATIASSATAAAGQVLQPQPEANANVQLTACPTCSRTFNPQALRKHMGICEKMVAKKRNKFDSQRQRREGTDLASYPLPPGYGLPPLPSSGGSSGGGGGSSGAGGANAATTTAAAAKGAERGHSPKPQQQPAVLPSPTVARKRSTDDFSRTTARTSMRKRSNSTNSSAAAAPAPGGGGGGTSPTSASNAPSQFVRDRMRSSERSMAKRIQAPAAEQCPHCERCFGVKAYDRHVEWCKEKALLASIKQTTKTEQNVAKERLEARTKYRAPCLKTKRSMNREKYSGLAGDENDFGDSPKANNNNSNSTNNNSFMSLSMTSSMTSDSRNVFDSSALENFEEHHRDNQEDQQLNFQLNGIGVCTRKSRRDSMPPAKTNKNRHTNAIDIKAQTTNDLYASELKASLKRGNSRELLPTSSIIGLNDEAYAHHAHLASDNSDSSTNNNKSSTKRNNRNKLKAINVKRSDINLELSAVHVATPTSTARRSASLGDCNALLERRPKQQQPQRSEEGAPRRQASLSRSNSTSRLRTAATATTNAPTSTIFMSQKNAVTDVAAVAATLAHNESVLLTKLEAKSTTKLERPKRKRLTRTSSNRRSANNNNDHNNGVAATSTSQQPMKATLPLLQVASNELLGRPSRARNRPEHSSSAGKPTAGDDDSKEIRFIKSPPPTLAYQESVRANSPPQTYLAELLPTASMDETAAGPSTSRPPLLTMPPQPSMQLLRNRSFILNGYDPFLSAKRQLEELCSPIAATESFDRAAAIASATAAKLLSNSFTMGSSSSAVGGGTQHTLTSPLTPKLVQRRNSNTNTSTPNAPPTTAAKMLPLTASNFRRTASLRGPRRTPPSTTATLLLANRPPLFAQKQRPTIQRGLSDEGPISSNFLKPEEYDEMPVRAACVNDFALANSPRVVRRDTSLSNRKHNNAIAVKVAAGGGGLAGDPTKATAAAAPNAAALAAREANSSDERLTSKYLSKTDSLAVFLKYETELEKLAQPNNANATPRTLAAPATGTADQGAPVISKELKDKSNNLSKQNSAKSIHAGGDVPPTAATANAPAHGMPQKLPLRLEPISRPGTAATPAPSPSVQASAKHAPQLPAVSLHALLGSEPSPPPPPVSQSTKERQNSCSSNEFIDPKLINKCDNLPVSLVGGRSMVLHANAAAVTTAAAASHNGGQPQASGKNTSGGGSDVAGDNKASAPTTATTPSATANASQRNSGEGRCLLKRKMRLGRNQFLYDASPDELDSSCCSADDESNNRSSMECDSRQQQQQQQVPPQRQQQHFFSDAATKFEQQQAPPIPLTTPTLTPTTATAHKYNIPTLPTFDDFDFEEFLSSFTNDEEQFPLFKDCREFLLNRTSGRQQQPRSMHQATAIDQHYRQQPQHYSSKPHTPLHYHSAAAAAAVAATSPPPPAHYAKHFQFPNVTSGNSNTLNPHSHRSKAPGDSLETLANKDHAGSGSGISSKFAAKYAGELRRTAAPADAVAAEDEHPHGKREIFISIETEQNDLGGGDFADSPPLPISPNSLRNMVGNSQTVVEVERVADNDNKFSRISDDDEAQPPPLTQPNAANLQHLPNVQLNNAKNLIQKMQNDFRQLSEEVGANLRQVASATAQHQAASPRTASDTAAAAAAVGSVQATAVMPAAALLYGDASGGGGGGGSGSGGGGVVRAGVRTAPPGGRGVDDESDDMSSLDGYPMSSAHSSKRGVGSKLSADSAYGSLSRQRSSDLSTQRSLSRTRPATANAAPMALPPNTMQQHQQPPQQHPHYKYAGMKNRGARTQFGDDSTSNGSSSSSDNSLPPIHSQQQQQQQFYKKHNPNNNNNNNNNGNSNMNRGKELPNNVNATTPAGLTADDLTNANIALLNSSSSSNNNNNNNHHINNIENNNNISALMSAASHSMHSQSNYSLTNSLHSSTTPLSMHMSTSMLNMKMSKYCHECGSKFIIEQAKFCMDCGVKRIVL